MNDVRVDVFRSSGPGGQSVNTTDSAVRLTHVPTGIVVSCQNEKSQLQNKESALRILRARLLAAQSARRPTPRPHDIRKSQMRTVDRSERIRTYNYPENRIADHRTGYKAYNLDHVLAGDLGPVIQSAIDADEAARLAPTRTSAAPARAARARRRRTLADAGVPSPDHDARELAAFVDGRERGSPLETSESDPDALRGASRRSCPRRAAREPLQHILGYVGVPLRHSPGARGRVRAASRDGGGRASRDRRGRALVAATGADPLVVDLCCGSGAIAASVAT